MSKQVTIPNRIHGESIAIGLLPSDSGFQVANDGWFQVLKVGEFPHAESGTVQIVDDEALTKVVNRFNSVASTENFPGLLVDYDHFSMDRNQSSAAAGWIDKLEIRNGGVWAHARWTPTGLARIQGGEYRLTSPVLTDFVATEDGDESNRIRPGAIDSVALTNNPNIRGMVPVSNRGKGGASEWKNKSARNSNSSMNYKNELCRMLGLNADATDEDIQMAIDEMANAKRKNADAMDEEKTKIEIENRRLARKVDELEKTHKEIQNRRVEEALVTHKEVIGDKEEDKAAWKNRLASNFDDAISLLTQLGERFKTPPEKGGVKPRKEGTPPEPRHRNRGNHPDSADKGEDANIAARQKLATKISLRRQDLMAANRKLTYQQADARARLEFLDEIEETEMELAEA